MTPLLIDTAVPSGARAGEAVPRGHARLPRHVTFRSSGRGGSSNRRHDCPTATRTTAMT